MIQLLKALSIARETTNLRLLIVGKLKQGNEKEFYSLINKFSLEKHVSITGWLPYDKVGKMDAKAQIGLVTMQPSGNNYGSISNKLYSYMACGQATIVPANSATAELVKEYKCGLAVNTTKPQEIANAIIKLSNDASLRKKLGANGRKAIEEYLGWDKMKTRLLEIYDTLKANGNSS